MKNLKNSDINNIQNNNLIQGGVVMKSNMYKMIISCLCIWAIGMAADVNQGTKQTMDQIEMQQQADIKAAKKNDNKIL